MYRGLIYLFVILLFLEISMADVLITEVMYDPECSDSYCEYVEIYNNNTQTINITSWTIEDSGSVDVLEGNDEDILIPGNGYGIIVDSDSRIYSNFEVDDNVIWIYADDTAIGNGLSNTETIILKDENTTIVSNVTYDGSTNGKSYNLIDDSWNLSDATPGYGYNNVIIDYSKIKISEFLPDPNGDDNQAMPNGEWVELYNSGEIDLDLMEFKFKDNVGDEADVVITQTTTNQGTVIKSKEYLVVYANGISSFLNNNGLEKITLYDLNDNIVDSISYDGSDEGVSWSLAEDEWQKSTPTPGQDNFDEKQSIESEIKIEEIYDLGDGAAEWGDIIRVKFYAYKGNTNQNVIWMWVEDKNNERVTKQSKFDIYDKFQNYTITYPIFIPENCDSGFESGKGRVVISGFDVNVYEELEIRETPLCKNSTSARKSLFEYELMEFPEEVDGDEFKSQVKLKNNDDESLKVDVWGYVYSGNKQYVSSEKENLQSIELNPEEEKIIELNTKMVNLENEKDYRFKIKVLKDGRVTPYDITKEIAFKSENVKKPLDSITGSAIYESKGFKAQRSAVFFFGGLMMTLSLFMFWIRWK